jgi:hypothetical protein
MCDLPQVSIDRGVISRFCLALSRTHAHTGIPGDHFNEIASDISGVVNSFAFTSGGRASQLRLLFPFTNM